MTTIKITPEQLMTVSEPFKHAQQTIAQMNSQLTMQISFISTIMGWYNEATVLL
jgi:hypothetical protein